jgi:DnaD/phage-associated family protein
MPAEVITMLVCYCIDRISQKGSNRKPSLRTIEKEAYAWAERGIDTMEEAIAFTQSQAVRNSRIGRLKQLLQLSDRKLTGAEERYIQQWLDWGFDDAAISMAYERTCLNTGGLKWPYMNKILSSWQQAGLLTGQQVQGGDRKPSVPKGASGQLGAAELEAIQRVLQED